MKATVCEWSGIDPGLHARVEPGHSASLTLGRHSIAGYGGARGGATPHPSR